VKDERGVCPDGKCKCDASDGIQCPRMTYKSYILYADYPQNIRSQVNIRSQGGYSPSKTVVHGYYAIRMHPTVCSSKMVDREAAGVHGFVFCED